MRKGPSVTCPDRRNPVRIPADAALRAGAAPYPSRHEWQEVQRRLAGLIVDALEVGTGKNEQDATEDLFDSFGLDSPRWIASFPGTGSLNREPPRCGEQMLNSSLVPRPRQLSCSMRWCAWVTDLSRWWKRSTNARVTQIR